MGTNYYLVTNRCPHCGRSDRRHIGKSSRGWTFALHVYPEEGINTLEDWKPLLKAGQIEDEYGRASTFEELLHTITERSYSGPTGQESAYGAPGPNGLLRHKIGYGCVGHGEGTWDYLDSDFS